MPVEEDDTKETVLELNNVKIEAFPSQAYYNNYYTVYYNIAYT
jgi:hypothetical protein